MIKKTAAKKRLGEYSEIKENLKYWLGKTPAQRIEAVNILRRKKYGDRKRLQRTARVVQRPQG
ncbi:MAG: hypothetical protein ABSE89_00330 [Sedimentisphaerales bacterium]